MLERVVLIVLWTCCCCLLFGSLLKLLFLLVVVLCSLCRRVGLISRLLAKEFLSAPQVVTRACRCLPIRWPLCLCCRRMARIISSWTLIVIRATSVTFVSAASMLGYDLKLISLCTSFFIAATDMLFSLTVRDVAGVHVGVVGL